MKFSEAMIEKLVEKLVEKIINKGKVVITIEIKES